MVAKKTDSGPDFRLTRSRHPSASGRRIGPSAGDGWAARRDPKTNSSVLLIWGGAVLLLKCGCSAPADNRGQGTDTPVPVPVPVPDLSGDGDGASVPDLAGDGDAPPSPSPIC